MITANPHRRRRRRVVSNPIRHVRRRRTVHMNPHRSYRHARRHRNPGGGFLSSLFDKQGLMLLGAVVATPTIMSEGQSMLAPSATGYYQAGIQGAIGVGLGWAAYKFLDRQVGVVMAAVGIGTAVAQLINGYNAGTLSNSVLNGYPVAPPVVGKFQVRNTLGSREAGARTLSGYTGAGVGGRACSVMSGYTNTLARIPEPGARRIR
jgi:hypothetical protein